MTKIKVVVKWTQYLSQLVLPAEPYVALTLPSVFLRHGAFLVDTCASEFVRST